jgi:hypothetical protein
MTYEYPATDIWRHLDTGAESPNDRAADSNPRLLFFCLDGVFLAAEFLLTGYTGGPTSANSEKTSAS